MAYLLRFAGRKTAGALPSVARSVRSASILTLISAISYPMNTHEIKTIQFNIIA